MVQAPPPRTADEWARDKRIMPPSAPIPGPFNPDTNPYMRPVAWAFAQPCFSRVTFVMGTQMGKSVTMENVIGHRLDEDPTPCLYVAPTKPLITGTVEPKFMAMFDECKSLASKYEARSTQTVKWIGGTKFRFAWAGSATELAADSAGLVLVDEVDRIVNTGEGDTTEIIEARGDAYADSKVGYTATPTHGKVERRKDERTGLWHWVPAEVKKIGSKVWQLWQSGTRHEWAVPCPSCSEYFVPWSGLLWWPGKGSKDECTPDEAFKQARLVCPCCGDMIEDKFRPWMNARGVAVAPGESIAKGGKIEGTADTAGFTHFSFWVSGLCSFAVKKSVHPRWRGEHSPSRATSVSTAGSSPLARGTRLSTQTRSLDRRFIPAGAGNTGKPAGARLKPAVHPRWRGEHQATGSPTRASCGSSPLARGTQCSGMVVFSVSRFIPAGAGNTTRMPPSPTSQPVHPRWRGEHRRRLSRIGRFIGSSPLARGTRRKDNRPGAVPRFIPAGAGNTIRCAPAAGRSAVHPRWRGEHPFARRQVPTPDGSSPLARGTRLPARQDQAGRRFIPAGAGNTILKNRMHLQFRFIPAGAGNTNPPRRAARAIPVHPRWRGEHGSACE